MSSPIKDKYFYQHYLHVSNTIAKILHYVLVGHLTHIFITNSFSFLSEVPSPTLLLVDNKLLLYFLRYSLLHFLETFPWYLCPANSPYQTPTLYTVWTTNLTLTLYSLLLLFIFYIQAHPPIKHSVPVTNTETATGLGTRNIKVKT